MTTRGVHTFGAHIFKSSVFLLTPASSFLITISCASMAEHERANRALTLATLTFT